MSEQAKRAGRPKSTTALGNNVLIRISAELKKQLEEEAAQANVSFSAHCRSIFEQNDTKKNRLEMENAALIRLLEEIGNEIFMAGDDGAFYAEQGDSPFMKRLATKLNEILL